VVESTSYPERAALVIAHPGHELRVHGWLERARPLVFVLTDGSGRAGGSRLPSTTRILERAGARCGSVYGAFTDRQLYAAMLAGDTALFVALAAQLSRALADHHVSVVASDAAEGFNPAHDLCCHLTAAVVERAQAEGRAIAALTFPLEAAPHADGDADGDGRVRVDHSDGSFERKIAAAREYVAVASEVERALATHGTDAFRSEVLTPLQDPWAAPTSTPQYEQFGERRQAAGAYVQVVRRREHMDPIVAALRQFAAAAAVS
jgi:hypothetical protein